MSTTAADKLLDFVKEKGLRVERILESHVHADHLTSSAYLKRKLKAMGGHGLDGNSAPLVCIGEKVSVVQETFGDIFKIPVSDMPRDGSQFDHLFKDGESFKLGKLDCKVMFTPGHTPACSTVLIGPDAAFCGDTIFLPDVGSARVDFPKGSAEALFKSIKETIFGLSENVRIFVGLVIPREPRIILLGTTFANPISVSSRLQLLHWIVTTTLPAIPRQNNQPATPAFAQPSKKKKPETSTSTPTPTLNPSRNGEKDGTRPSEGRDCCIRACRSIWSRAISQSAGWRAKGS